MRTTLDVEPISKRKTHDALGRRHPFAGPQPLGIEYEYTSNDRLVNDALHRHRTLPSHYLFKFQKLPNEDRFKRRLTLLSNEAPVRLIRPAGQKRTHIRPPLCYQNSQYTIDNLGLYTYPQRYDDLKHDLFASTVTASLELRARDHNVGYKPAHEMLTHELCPVDTLVLDDPFTIKLASGAVQADGYSPFGLEYEPELFRWFVLEADCGTENQKRSKKYPNRVSIEEKFDKWIDVLQHRRYKTQWGIFQLTILIAAPTRGRVESMMKTLRQKNSKYAKCFAFAVVPYFGLDWIVPPDVMNYLYDDPWVKVDGLLHLNRPYEKSGV